MGHGPGCAEGHREERRDGRKQTRQHQHNRRRRQHHEFSGGGTNAVATDKKESDSDEIQLSFQGANVDMIVQWLAEKTGKTVIKHPRVQCQLTITGSKKITKREALNLVYRALSLEGFTAIESSKAIMIVPEGSEPKMSAEMLGGKDIPEGRQKLVKIYSLHHVQAAEIKEKVKTALSEKGTIETTIARTR